MAATAEAAARVGLPAGAAAGAAGRAAGALGAAAVAGPVPTSETVLSVSRSRSARLVCSVAQKRFEDTLLMLVLEVLPPPTELLEPIEDVVSRAMLG